MTKVQRKDAARGARRTTPIETRAGQPSQRAEQSEALSRSTRG